jgi:hypothetical protein
MASCTGAVLVQRLISGEGTVAVTAFEILIVVVGGTMVNVLIVAIGGVEPPLARIAVVRHLDERFSWWNGFRCSTK